ncbi:helix-hairpin-helix domain-containing protein [Gracilibacillus marinus]|jgi:competence protein ComEA|uniref:Helix-hairpin-helix domain-containing protein n=1 Tax=Gracilibacillus marinus TaxID=630535 RepID=A0ABV8W053_9BACI
MSWLRKNWYIILFIFCFVVWMIINPTPKNIDKNAHDPLLIEASNESNDEYLEEDIDTELHIEMVDVKGEVKFPGVYRIEAGERIEDVIKKAGGLTDEADSNSINLAEKVYDEMVIIVAQVNEVGEIPQMNAGKTSDGKIRINKATKEELMEISGIGEAKANAIIEYRETNGDFKQLEDLSNVSGIGEKTVERISEQVQIP